MNLRFTPPFDCGPGTIARLLNRSYAKMVEAEPEIWVPESKRWEQADRDTFDHPDTIGKCTFLSWYENNLAGFFCFDPRGGPDYGVIGHNCILPEYRGNGLGKQQIMEIIKRFRTRGIRLAQVSTNDHPFFVPAQRMYTACGFEEVKRTARENDPQQFMIHYERKIT